MKSRRFKKSRRQTRKQSRKKGGKVDDDNVRNCERWKGTEYAKKDDDCNELSKEINFPGFWESNVKKRKPEKKITQDEDGNPLVPYTKYTTASGYLPLPTKEELEELKYGQRIERQNQQNKINQQGRRVVRDIESQRINSEAIGAYRK